ncbi:MAG: IPTL-CTERM sorting domain-containing protein [Planctomycetes bacterium]|nr:IPTL-CTERM sorting domain-containing protein [Planctomycetota bacterium]MBI3833044.1 IPTL-CTERM sorting domain-containing protein [Planctomycetota bacterium]
MRTTYQIRGNGHMYRTFARTALCCAPAFAAIVVVGNSNSAIAQTCHYPAPTCPTTCSPGGCSNVCDPKLGHGEGATASCQGRCVGETLSCNSTSAYVDMLGDAIRLEEAFDTVHGNVRVPAVGNLPIIRVLGNAVCTNSGGACNPATGANCVFPCLVGQGGSTAGDPSIGLTLPGIATNGSVRVTDNQYVILPSDVGNLGNQFTFVGTDLCTSCCSNCPQTCDTATASSNTIVPNCNDQDGCTIDCCSAGVCSHPSDCIGAQSCRGTDGQITNVPPISCDDGNVCTSDTCVNDADPATACCANTPIQCPAQPCEFNTGCDPVLGCQYVFDCRQPGPNCCPDDGNPCTHEFCNQANGTCGETPDCTIPADCNDGLNCTVESCVNSCCEHAGLCAPGIVCCADGASCDDNNACTDDVCSNGCCAHTPHACPAIACKQNTGCDPISGCLYVDDCRTGSLGACCPDDGNACTHETCDASTGLCGFTPDCVTSSDCPHDACTTATCTNSCCGTTPNSCPPIPCKRNTGCDPTAGCIYVDDCRTGALGSCCPDDGNQCTHESCDQATGACGATRDCSTAGDCDDGLHCTIDSCSNSCCNHLPLCSQGVVCCADGVSCDDGDDCTVDSCVGGCCAHVPDPSCVPHIPTVSQWGLVVLSLLLMTGLKLRFGRREAKA